MVDEVVIAALGRLAQGRPDDARAELAAPGGGRLRRELAVHLAARDEDRVYDAPAAFQAFIGGGGNVGLYRAATDRLTATYRALDAHAVLDVGCGDGRVVLPAAAALGERAPELDLVEPSTALLAAAVAAAAGRTVRAHQGTVQDLLAGRPQRRWDLVQSTFALHAIAPAQRGEVLAALRGVADAVLIVEFDVPAFADGGPEHLAYLAQRYERGLAEYDGSLVAQGFLLPVLVGQVQPGRVRHTWEQPGQAWREQLTAAGWCDVTVESLADYWWAPAIVVTGRAGAGEDAAAAPAAEAALAAERAATHARIAAFGRRFDDIVAGSALTTDDDEHDPEGATIGFERAQVSGLLAQAHDELAALDRAVARLAAGDYGTCLRCGRPIADDRLAARPAVETCIECARDAERRR